MNNRLNEYLRELEVRLRFLPDADREAELAEIAAHLDALIAGKIADGQSEADATGAALAQFGNARRIGSRLYQETGKRKRWASLWETALFCAAFSTVFTLAYQLILWVLDRVSYAAEWETLFRFAHRKLGIMHPTLGWPLNSWPISESIGIAALGILLLRYGGREVWQKTKEQTTTGTAMRYLVCAYGLGFLLSTWGLHLLSAEFLINRWYGNVGFEQITLTQQNTVLILTNVQSLLTGFLIAYFVGRTNKTPQSAGEAVGCAVAVSAVIGFLQAAFAFIPLPWINASYPPYFHNWLTATSGLAISISYGVVRFYIARFAVYLGEAHRSKTVV